MSTQEPPLASQRRHWYVKESGGSPAQIPSEVVSVAPGVGVPEIAGRDVFEGGTAILAVGAAVALALPTAFVAVTTARIVAPPSASVSTYVADVAPAMSAHEPPPESQRRH